MLVQTAGGSVQQIPVKKEWPKGVNRGGIDESLAATMSCGIIIMSGFVGPVG